MGLKISRQESIYRFCLSRFVFGKEICLASYLSTTKYNAVFIRLEQYQLLFKGYKKLDNRELINQLWLVFNFFFSLPSSHISRQNRWFCAPQVRTPVKPGR